MTKQMKKINFAILLSIMLVFIFITGCQVQKQEETKETDSGQDDGGVTVVVGDGAAEKTESKSQPQAQPEAIVKEFLIIAKQWSFVPDTITVSKGDTVRLKITSVDVTHGFALPDFDVSVNLQPGEEEVIEFVADKEGTFRFYCSVFCGSGHSSMDGNLVVQ